jgi:hypothetical protein
MRIVLNEPESGTELQLEVNKVDTSSGVGWSVLTPQKKKVLIKCREGLWTAEDDHSISQEFWQMVGNKIDQALEAGRTGNEISSANLRPKRARIVKN